MMKWFMVYYLLILGVFPSEKTTHMERTDKQILLGKFNPQSHPDYIKAVAPYTHKDGMYLHKETYDAFKKMHEAAKTDGITLVIVSATRNFDRQKQIWENKWNGVTLVGGKNLKQTISDPVERAEKILSYSSMPGTSRHHWGTDIDINSVSPSYFQSGKGLKEYNWLVENAPVFGFCQPYKHKGIERETGYEDEAWHWTYTPLSCKFTRDYIETVTYDDITGFAGSETAKQIDVIQNYVLGIHHDCTCKE